MDEVLKRIKEGKGIKNTEEEEDIIKAKLNNPPKLNFTVSNIKDLKIKEIESISLLDGEEKIMTFSATVDNLNQDAKAILFGENYQQSLEPDFILKRSDCKKCVKKDTCKFEVEYNNEIKAIEDFIKDHSTIYHHYKTTIFCNYFLPYQTGGTIKE